jgi:hypothetical protein
MKIGALSPEELGVTIGGQNILMVPLQVRTNYTLYGGDITAFAGQVEEFRFGFDSAIFGSFLELDSIEFSPEAIPEPRSLSLITGAFFLAIAFARRGRMANDVFRHSRILL